MRKLFYFLLLIVFISCQKEDALQTKYVVDSLKIDKKQIVEFTLIDDTIIVGNEGTKIFVSKNMFKNYSSGLIVLELIENYEFEDIVLNSIETVTNDNKLLESSGVLFINFKENGKQLVLADQTTFTVQVQKSIKNKSEIYYAATDSVFRWELSKDVIYKNIPDQIKNIRYGLTVRKDGGGGYYKSVPLDSVSSVKIKDSLYLESLNRGSGNRMDYLLDEDALVYEGNIDSLYLSLEEERKNESLIYEFNASRLGYINIDRLLEFERQESLTIIERTKSFSNLNISYIYKNNNSFYNDYWENSKKDFKPEIKIKGKIKVVVYVAKENEIYSDSFYVDSKSKTTFIVDLEKTTIEKLKKEMLK